MGWVNNTPDDTPTGGPMITGVALAFTSLSLVVVCLRLYVRGYLIKAIGHDDWTIVVAWLGACGYTSATVLQTKWGLGLTQLDDMPDENVRNFGKVQYAGAPFYVLAIWGFKMSLLLSYLRFIAGRYRFVIIAVLVACVMAHLAFLGVFLFLCIPIEMQWDQSVEGTCGEAVPFYLSFSALTIVFDVVVMLLPFPVLLRTQIPRRKKLVILGLFALGVFVTAIQIVRIQTIKNLVNYLDSAKSITWSIVECDIGIIIASVPTLAPLVKYFAERTRVGTGSGSHAKTGSQFAMQSWRSRKNDMRGFGGGHENEPGVVRNKNMTDSTEDILGPGVINKRTEVVVTTQAADEISPGRIF